MVEDILAVALIFGGGTLFLLAISPIGRALAERIRSRPEPNDPQHEALEAELQQLRQEVGELAERVDFMERLRAASREVERLAPPARPPR
ncbi:MAG TPA: hypothetical protein VLT79_03385 [Gemmatimonadales bacterium]|nr:hypothetical protein [Gemmatimonadales bacterium]